MSVYSCAREAELMVALREQRWPAACEPALRDHVAGCRHCRELVLVTQSLQQARVGVAATVNLPPPGILWWRAQLLRRNGAIEQVNQPILLAQRMAWACAGAITLGFAFWQRQQVSDWLYWTTASLRADSLALSASPDGWRIALFSAVLGTLSLLGGVAVYLAAKQE